MSDAQIIEFPIRNTRRPVFADELAALYHDRVMQALITERKRRGVNQIDLSRRIGKSQTWISRLETRDRQRIDVGEFMMIARAVGCNPLVLLQQTIATIEQENAA
jgi:transcriptional regulator with XRE-family HTH domain